MEKLKHAMLNASIFTMFVVLAVSSAAFSAEKVILDTDMEELFDDGVTMIMLANHPKVELLGVTVVTGNKWLQDGLSAGIRQLELGGFSNIPVVAGARRPMRAGRYEAVAPPSVTGLKWSGYERALFGIGEDDYAGAFSSWGHPEPVSPDPATAWETVYRKNYGAAPSLDLRMDSRIDFSGKYQRASDFIVEMVNKYPNEITIVAIGPCTNLQMAVMLDPTIVSKVKRIIYMGGAINVAGNTTPAAEFNWWFDPESAKSVLRTPWGKNTADEDKITQYIVPLDVCGKLYFTHEQYDKIVNLPGIKPGIKAMFEKHYGADYAAPGSKAKSYVWDTITAGILLGWLNGDDIILPFDEDLSKTGYMDWWIDVNSDYGLDYGRSLGYAIQGPPGTQKVRIINAVDENKFWELVYAGLDPGYTPGR
jgi:inosine-uridine nucleoside N-ribohydrolase